MLWRLGSHSRTFSIILMFFKKKKTIPYLHCRMWCFCNSYNESDSQLNPFFFAIFRILQKPSSNQDWELWQAICLTVYNELFNCCYKYKLFLALRLEYTNFYLQKEANCLQSLWLVCLKPCVILGKEFKECGAVEFVLRSGDAFCENVFPLNCSVFLKTI